MKIPAELSSALLVFAGELSKWMDESDRRLVGFEPLKAWETVVDLMARDGNDFICNCPECAALRGHIEGRH